MGFMFLDRIANNWRKKYNYEFSIKENLFLVKPLTYMNLSGEIFNYINPKDFGDIIVVYDDVSLPLGKIRIRKKGSHGGHKGVKSIISHLGTDFNRIRIGIGPLPDNEDLVNFVLGEFSNRELEIVNKALNLSYEALKTIVNEGIDKAMSLFNAKEVER
ncbi:Aminoacyl-tRNA hydrolase [Thermosipho melanesiensis BI429]|uniref:Aminoacyl-tRNA hydrolase n=1 Tax=Thermosipho melanesiensis (strain DSM 12029 / CIP 104789 / BI429) TaxID=391009 RepID=A6LJD9_THEM4|nr:Aminoacyl-tRNA hydrolase [Thermosipho melanesiensis BI429]